MSQELPNDSINPTLQISTQPAGHISNASNYSSGMENVFDDGILDSGDDDSLRQADDASRFDHEIALQRFNRVQEWLEKDPPWTPWGRRTFSPGAYPCSMPQNGRKILNNFDADTISNTTPPGTINPKNLMPQVETQDTGYIFPEEETSENEASETEIPGLEGSQPEESEREIPGSQPEGSESEGLEALVLEAKKSKLEIQEAEMPDVTTQEDEYDESNEDHPCASFLYANGPESKEGKKAAKTCIFEPHRRLQYFLRQMGGKYECPDCRRGFGDEATFKRHVNKTSKCRSLKTESKFRWTEDKKEYSRQAEAGKLTWRSMQRITSGGKEPIKIHCNGTNCKRPRQFSSNTTDPSNESARPKRKLGHVTSESNSIKRHRTIAPKPETPIQIPRLGTREDSVPSGTTRSLPAAFSSRENEVTTLPTDFGEQSPRKHDHADFSFSLDSNDVPYFTGKVGTWGAGEERL